MTDTEIVSEIRRLYQEKERLDALLEHEHAQGTDYDECRSWNAYRKAGQELSEFMRKHLSRAFNKQNP